MNRRILIVVGMIVGLAVGNAHALEGAGTEGDPWLIQSLEDFNDFAGDPNYWDGYARLEKDVNLAGMVYDRAVIGDYHYDDGWVGTPFTGVFDGNDHKIIGLTIDDGGVGNDYIGLFGIVRDPNAEIKNLGLIHPNVDMAGDSWSVGSLVRGNDYATITNCYVDGGSVVGNWYVGGLVGENWNHISNCYSTSSVSGELNVGGLVGYNASVTITNCYSKGSVRGNRNIGGLAGKNQGEVFCCYSTSFVIGTDKVGGLVGLNYGYYVTRISNCYSTGDVNGVRYVGGLVGENFHEYGQNYIYQSYPTSDVSGSYVFFDEVGGLIGYNDYDCWVYECFVNRQQE